MMLSNPNLDTVNINVYTKFSQSKMSSLKLHNDISYDMERKRILTSIKGRNSITNFRKMVCNNSKVDLVIVNVYT